MSVTGRQTINAVTGNPLTVQANGINALVIDASRNATFSGSGATGVLNATTPSNASSISMASLMAPGGTGDVYFSVGKSLTIPNAALVGWSATGGTYAFLTTYGRPASDLAVLSNGRVGIGTVNPERRLEINSSTGDCLRLTHNDADGQAAYCCDLTVSSAGNLTVWPTGGNITLAGQVAINAVSGNPLTVQSNGTTVLYVNDAKQLWVRTGTNQNWLLYSYGSQATMSVLNDIGNARQPWAIDSASLSIRTEGAERIGLTTSAIGLSLPTTINAVTGNPLTVQANGADALVIDASKNAAFGGNITGKVIRCGTGNYLPGLMVNADWLGEGKPVVNVTSYSSDGVIEIYNAYDMAPRIVFRASYGPVFNYGGITLNNVTTTGHAVSAIGNSYSLTDYNVLFKDKNWQRAGVAGYQASSYLDELWLLSVGDESAATHLAGDAVLGATKDVHVIPNYHVATGGPSAVYLYARGQDAANQRVTVTPTAITLALPTTINAVSGSPLTVQANSVNAFEIDASRNATFFGTISCPGEGSYSERFGRLSFAATSTTSLGYAATDTGTNGYNTVIGAGARCTGASSQLNTLIGRAAYTAENVIYGTAVGDGAHADSSYAVAIGPNAASTGTVVGFGCSGYVAYGYSSAATGAYGTAIGTSCTVGNGHSYSIALGGWATTSRAYECVIGGAYAGAGMIQFFNVVSGAASLILQRSGNTYLTIDTSQNVAFSGAISCPGTADYNSQRFGLYTVASGDQGTAVGESAHAKGQGVTSLGCNAGYDATGTQGTFLGYAAGMYRTGGQNVAVGYNALRGAQGTATGGENVAVGHGALYAAASTVGCVAIGYEALYDCANGVNNTSIGYFAGRNATAGNSNTFIGYFTGYHCTGNYNMCLGGLAGRGTAGNSNYGGNVLIGYIAGDGISTGNYNVAVGYSALNAVATGTGNVSLGFEAGKLCTGNYNVFIGYGAGGQATNVSSKLYIANTHTETPLIGGDFSTSDLTFNGKVAINAVTGNPLTVKSNGSTAFEIQAGRNAIFYGRTLLYYTSSAVNSFTSYLAANKAAFSVGQYHDHSDGATDSGAALQTQFWKRGTGNQSYLYGVYSSVALSAASAGGIYYGFGLDLPLNFAEGSTVSIDEYASIRLSAAKGTTGTVGKMYGLRVLDLGIGTTSYGVHLGLAAKANTWNLYVEGAAPNYFAGKVGIGTNDPQSLVHINAVTGDPLLVQTSGVEALRVTSQQKFYLYGPAGQNAVEIFCGTSGNTHFSFTSDASFGNAYWAARRQLYIQSGTGHATSDILFQQGGVTRLQIAVGGALTANAATGSPLTVQANGVNALVIDASRDVALAGAVVTGVRLNIGGALSQEFLRFTYGADPSYHHSITCGFSGSAGNNSMIFSLRNGPNPKTDVLTLTDGAIYLHKTPVFYTAAAIGGVVTPKSTAGSHER